MRRSRRALVVLLIAPIAGCGDDSTGPRNGRGDPGITIAAGANVTDTIDATPDLALRVIVRDRSGRPVPGVTVRFTSVPSGGVSFTPPTVLVGDVGAAGMSDFLAETTSDDGVALARIRLGQIAGPGAVAISVPQLGLADTARFTIMPGAAARIVLPVADTTIRVGRTLPLSGRVEDRYGNERADAITFDVVGTGLTITSGQVSASAPARAAVIGRRGTLAPDTTWVSVVPVATIAARRGYRLVTGALDGTGLTDIPHPLEPSEYSPDWHPSGQSLLAVLSEFGGPTSLYRVELNGAIHRMVEPTTAPNGYSSIPGFIYGFASSPDAQWLYLSGGNCNYSAILYRVPVTNPRGIERLSPTGVDECFELVNHGPSLSPDGTRLVYENQTWNRSGYSVRVMTIATRAISQIAAGGQRPRWSPTGELIAYWADKQIWVVRPDGTGARVVSPPGRAYVPGVQWSPDGQWILARFEPMQGWAGTTVALLNVSNGLEIPLAWTSGYNGIGLPAWKPVP